MHLLAAQPGVVDNGVAIDLDQSPGDIVVLTAADSEIACLAAARQVLEKERDNLPSLRLASTLSLAHNLSVDLYVERVVSQAKLVVARVLGGQSYWPHGVEQIVGTCRRRGIALALLPGDDQPDPGFAGLSTLPAEATHRLWQYFVFGGIDNAGQFLRYAANLTGARMDWREPAPVLRAGFHWPGCVSPSLADIRVRWTAQRPVAAIVFYRALALAANTAAIDVLIEALHRHGLSALPIQVASLKDPMAAAMIAEAFAAAPPDIVLATTGFALGEGRTDPLAAPNCPVLQVVLSGGEEEAWRAGTNGLAARDLAMNVALPEIDGRILTRAIAFKGRLRRDEATQTDIVGQVPLADRVEFTAALAAAWVKLRRTPPGERRIALVLANYPNRDGRIGNGVGLDTPASTIAILGALKEAGYDVRRPPVDGAALVRSLLAGPSNDKRALSSRVIAETLPLSDYAAFFSSLPRAVRDKVTARWGSAESDPCFLPGATDCGAFAIAALRFGKIVVGLQPSRGYDIDPARSYHDPDLPPPHGYLAFYAWLRLAFRADAIVDIGKHGNLEWLPGKALALSDSCFPEAAFGPMPHLYPFIVNDPGEGTQAKRRAQAVIVDHLTPPLTRAESYGPLRELECLIDEYYEASGLDPRRLKLLGGEILDLTRRIGLDRDCGIAPNDDATAALVKLDSFLCEIKELQIRDGLHVFGRAPADGQLVDLLVALSRLPRRSGDNGDASLLRALAADLGLDFDPLDCDMAAPWTGPRPSALADGSPWRSHGDTVERLEFLGKALVAGERAAEPTWARARAVLSWIETWLRPAVFACGGGEIAGLLAGLDGRLVKPGPSGAPSRGRPEVLPTGRNFYSVDTRALPTPAAWTLGWKSAGLLLARHAQDHGEYPKALALSAWGTSAMRTGGDDIAQALALIGARPRWDVATGRVCGFEVLPASLLDRPRVDVTLRVSGFFRDAFPNLIELFDSAARAVAALDEPADVNPQAARVAAESARLVEAGASATEARLRAGYRVFGSKPGAYGAGLQALIDERGWDSAADLARAYVAWGGYAYGGGAEGQAEHSLFETRLSRIDAVVQNQDNREHDLFDSDDYYQFEGGLTAAIRHISGRSPTVYHNDHSRPESPKVRTLEEEAARILRARVVNPKWIRGVMRHGYKGAFEMAATVDYLFAFAATTAAVKDHHFDAVFDAYLRDETVCAFLKDANPAALREMSQRLLEAQARGLWRPRANDTHRRLTQLAESRPGRDPG
ncbi:MAG: cobaltochelatase subunit CobN [Rhodospirillaceae bacterium]|nr:cobaltochelatase subunit CobN [Rhodospirillaceae bacterium]